MKTLSLVQTDAVSGALSCAKSRSEQLLMLLESYILLLDQTMIYGELLGYFIYEVSNNPDLGPMLYPIPPTADDQDF